MDLYSSICLVFKKGSKNLSAVKKAAMKPKKYMCRKAHSAFWEWYIK